MKKIAITIGLYLFLLLISGCAHHAPPMAALEEFPPVFPVQKNWSTQIGGIGKQYLALTPVVDNGRIYAAGYNGYLTAIDLQSGRKVWQINTGAPLTSGLAAGYGMVFIGSGNGQILALDQDNGSIAWAIPVSSEVLGAPTVTPGQLLAKSEDGHLYAFDIRTGNPNWSYEEPTPELMLRSGSSPEIAQRFAVVGFANGSIGVFTLNGGQLIWKHPIAEPQGGTVIERMIDIDKSIQVVGDTIYVATYQGIVAALNLTTGNVIWQNPISSFAGLVVDQNTVYVVDADSHIWAFDRASGRLVWKQDNLFGRGVTGPALMGNAIVVADGEGYVHWLSRTDGHFLARERVDHKGIIATPVVVGHSVYIYANSGSLTKLSI